MAPARLPLREQHRLAVALRAGDPAALRELHAWLGPAVFAFLRQGLGDTGTAEDVCQVVFTEVWRRGADFDEARGSLTAWVMTIARSRAVDELRRRRPVPTDPARLPEDAAEAEVERLAEQWRMGALLQTLAPEDRELLRLRFYEDLSQTEIAARTGVPLGTVKARMVRGLTRLAELVGADSAPAVRVRARGEES